MSDSLRGHLQAAKIHVSPEGLQTIYFDADNLAQFIKQYKQLTRNIQRTDEEIIKMHLFDNMDSEIAYIDDSKHYSDYESTMMRYCIHQVLQERFEIAEVIFVDERCKVVSPRWQNAQIFRGEEGKVSIPKQAMFMLYDTEDTTVKSVLEAPWVVKIFTWEDGETQVNIYTDQEQEKVNELWQQFEDYFAEKGPLKGELFTPTGEYIENKGKTFDDVVLTDEIKDKIMMNAVDFFTNIDQYEKHGLSTSRGVILAGEPGTGKTLTLEAIITHFPNVTRIYATSETLMGRHHIRDLYRMARLLKPSIVFIEDIDTLGASDDEDYHRTPLLGEILAALNSIEPNDKVLTIATTNYPDALDIAIRDRPGRFDVRIDFQVPDKEGRKIILKQYLSNFKIRDNTMKYERIINATEGFSGAWLVELVQTSFSFALRDNPKNPTISMDNLESALSVVNENRALANKRRRGNDDLDPMFGV